MWVADPAWISRQAQRVQLLSVQLPGYQMAHPLKCKVWISFKHFGKGAVAKGVRNVQKGACDYCYTFDESSLCMTIASGGVSGRARPVWAHAWATAAFSEAVSYFQVVFHSPDPSVILESSVYVVSEDTVSVNCYLRSVEPLLYALDASHACVDLLSEHIIGSPSLKSKHCREPSSFLCH